MCGCSDGNAASTKAKEDKSKCFVKPYKTMYCGFKIK